VLLDGNGLPRPQIPGTPRQINGLSRFSTSPNFGDLIRP
jgi:hypothetical protein